MFLLICLLCALPCFADVDNTECVIQKLPQSKEDDLVNMARSILSSSPVDLTPVYREFGSNVNDLLTKVKELGEELVLAVEKSLLKNDTTLPDFRKLFSEGFDHHEDVIDTIVLAIHNYSETTQDFLTNVINNGDQRIAKLDENISEKEDSTKTLSNILQSLEEMDEDGSAIQISTGGIFNISEPTQGKNGSASLDEMMDLQTGQTEQLTAILTAILRKRDFISQNFLSAETTRGLQSSIEDIEAENEEIEDENLLLRSGMNESIHESIYHYKAIDCYDHYIAGHRLSGNFTIFPIRCDNDSSVDCRGVEVWCEMGDRGVVKPIPGEGWTVLLNRERDLTAGQFISVGGDNERNDGGTETHFTGVNTTLHSNSSNISRVNFTQNFHSYEQGFGFLDGDFFIGLSAIHAMTSNFHYTLAMILEYESGEGLAATWNRFHVSGLADKYRLKVRGYVTSSSLPDVLTAHNKLRFSTFDSDNDSSSDKSCADLYGGGWWFGKCYNIHPTGDWTAISRTLRQIWTSSWGRGKRKPRSSLKSIKMMIRPNAC